jgi:16S rRNA C967 or C1407 C5-methylase (RsmB/RsmF family)
MKLVPAEPFFGGPGISRIVGGSASVDDLPWLTPTEAGLVQRFDLSDQQGHDTIGFFIAKFRKETSR